MKTAKTAWSCEIQYTPVVFESYTVRRLINMIYFQ